MSLTIREVLENADYNLQNARMDIQITLAKEQLHNAMMQLDEGKGLDDDFTD